MVCRYVVHVKVSKMVNVKTVFMAEVNEIMVKGGKIYLLQFPDPICHSLNSCVITFFSNRVYLLLTCIIFTNLCYNNSIVAIYLLCKETKTL